VLIEAAGRPFIRHSREARERERHDERADRVRDREADMTKERAIEFGEALGPVGVACRVHLLQHVRMAAHRALAEDDEAPRQDVGAFHGNGDGNHLVTTSQIVLRPHADALAACTSIASFATMRRTR